MNKDPKEVRGRAAWMPEQGPPRKTGVLRGRTQASEAAAERRRQGGPRAQHVGAWQPTKDLAFHSRVRQV